MSSSSVAHFPALLRSDEQPVPHDRTGDNRSRSALVLSSRCAFAPSTVAGRSQLAASPLAGGRLRGSFAAVSGIDRSDIARHGSDCRHTAAFPMNNRPDRRNAEGERHHPASASRARAAADGGDAQGRRRVRADRARRLAGFAADVMGHMTGAPGLAIATLGPGATNLATGVGCAFLDVADDRVTCNLVTDQLGRRIQMWIDHHAVRRSPSHAAAKNGIDRRDLSYAVALASAGKGRPSRSARGCRARRHERAGRAPAQPAKLAAAR